MKSCRRDAILPLVTALLLPAGAPALAQSEADLAVSLDLPVVPLPVGVDCDLQVTATNNGPDSGVAADLEVYLDPAQWTIRGWSNPYGAGEVHDGLFSASLGALAPGETRAVSLSVRPEATGDLDLYAAVRDDYRFDPDETNNELQTVVPVAAAEADLALSVPAAPPDDSIAGLSFTMGLEVVDLGPAAVSAALVELAVSGSADWRLDGAVFGGDGWAAADSAGVELFFPDLPVDPGDGSTVRTCTLTFTALTSGELAFDGVVGSALVDPQPANDVVSDVVTIVPDEVDLSLTGFEVGSGPLAVDREVAFTVRLRNHGPLVATGTNLALTVSGTAPRDVDRIECPTGGGHPVQVGDQSVVEFVDLPVDPGDGSTEQVVLLHVVPLGEGSLELSAVVSCDQDESAPGDELVEDAWTCASVSAVGVATPPLRTLGAAPNPFNPRTEIRFELGRSAPVRILVYDVRGRVVRRLMDGEPLAAGPHRAEWDGRTDAGGEAASGAYFYRIGAAGHVARGRLQLVR